MKRFLCFVCRNSVLMKNARKVDGLTCGRCLEILSDIPPKAQKLLSFVFRRLEELENRNGRAT